jgi:O-6-methylguanine DNA methyltransferase
MNSDRIDDLLADHFRAEPCPPDLPGRVVHLAGQRRSEVERLARRLAIRASARGLTAIGLGRRDEAPDRAARRLVERAREELLEYLGGRRTFFSVPADLSALPEFQRRVLETAQRIPFGEARPYGWVAERTGSPGAARAVGTALARNPVPLVVPCHRVLRSDGSLGGYSLGPGPELKRALLDLERSTPVLEGCTSTHIICRVGCVHGRRVRAENRVVFASVEDARSVGYRPCRVCCPAAA